jgi:hypothetical protein
MSGTSRPEKSRDSDGNTATFLAGIIGVAVVLGVVWLFLVFRFPYHKLDARELAAFDKPRIEVARVLQKTFHPKGR